MKRFCSGLQLAMVCIVGLVFTASEHCSAGAAHAKTSFADPKTASQTAPALTSWTTHTDSAGFAVDLPAAWTIAKEPRTGQIALRGTRGEQIMIWPLFLDHVQLDARGAAALIQELARKFDPQMPWGSVQPIQNVVRVMAANGSRGAAAMLSSANGPSGASAYFYGIEAPTDIYRASTDSFIRILKSFHVVQDPSMKNPPEAAKVAGALTFVNWNDPHENAFSVSVPQGWQVIGGAYRLSAVDVHYSVVMGSPDGQVHAAIGDASIGGFIQPTPMLAMAGLREGMYYQLGDGSKLDIRRYLTGQQFARTYVELILSRLCTSPQIRANNVRQDLAATFNQAARSEGYNVPVDAGDVSFSCSLNNRPVQGKYMAGTIQLPGGSGIWFAYRLYGYLAVAGREQDAEKVLTQTYQSWKFNAQWEAQQRNTANTAVMQDNLRSQQIRERALQAIAEDQRQTSDTIMKGWEQRQKVYDEIDRRRENAILGTLDVIDPQTGTQYKVSNYGDYHYMSNEGYIYSTNSPGAPAPDLREMITLP